MPDVGPRTSPSPDWSQRYHFLSAIETRLPLPVDERTEVLEEIGSHLDDVVDDLVARGWDAGAAERRAQARLGPPDLLADELARARRSPRHLLEAAGVSLRVAVSTGISGLIVGYAAVFVTAFAAAMALQMIGAVTGTGWKLQCTLPGRRGCVGNAVSSGIGLLRHDELPRQCLGLGRRRRN